MLDARVADLGEGPIPDEFCGDLLGRPEGSPSALTRLQVWNSPITHPIEVAEHMLRVFPRLILLREDGRSHTYRVEGYNEDWRICGSKIYLRWQEAQRDAHSGADAE